MSALPAATPLLVHGVAVADDTVTADWFGHGMFALTSAQDAS